MADVFPPPGYIPTELAVPGIDVYMPIPPKQEEQPVVDFKCPQCGGSTAYSIEDGGLKCTNCGYYEPPAHQAVGRQAQQFEFKVETLEQAARGWGEARRQIECQSCHAVTVLPPGQLTYTCPFCGSNRVVQSDAAQDGLRPRYLIPFKIEPETCTATAAKWLGASWMLPAKLRQVAQIGSFTGIYLPFWTFDAQTKAAWRAQVGYDETRRTYDGKEWHTQTVTHWRWKTGNVTQGFDDLVVSGTPHVSDSILSTIDDFDLNALADYEPAYLAGMHAQAYAVPLEQAWDVGRAQMRAATRKACEQDALSGGGDHLRSLSMNVDFANESWRYVLLPVYLASFSFNDETFQVVVNGQSGSIGGRRPVDWLKVWAVVLAGFSLPLVAGVVGLIVPPLLFCAAVLLVLSVTLSIVLISNAQAIANPGKSDRLLKGAKPS